MNNGKVIYHSPGDGQLRSAIFCIYGGEVLPHIKEVDYDDGRFRITGYVGTESISRPNRQQQSLYINSRYVRSQQISYGVQRAFDTRIMVGKFPFYVLDIGVNYEDVDVNVHPNKMEVRFKDEQGCKGGYHSYAHGPWGSRGSHYTPGRHYYEKNGIRLYKCPECGCSAGNRTTDR